MKGKFITTQIMIVCMGNKNNRTKNGNTSIVNHSSLVLSNKEGSEMTISSIRLTETFKAA